MQERLRATPLRSTPPLVRSPRSNTAADLAPTVGTVPTERLVPRVSMLLSHAISVGTEALSLVSRSTTTSVGQLLRHSK
jgi:hypothetical protein